MLQTFIAKAKFIASLVMASTLAFVTRSPYFRYDFECIGADGKTKWKESIFNLVTTQGKNDLLDKYFKGSTYTAAWYLGLKGTGAADVAHTAALHAAWSEVAPYAGNRPAISWPGSAAAGSNTATANSYSCTGSATVAGAFVQSANTGTSGVLYSAADFGASRSVINGDTLNVTVTVSAT